MGVGSQLQLKELRDHSKDHGRGCKTGKTVLCCLAFSFCESFFGPVRKSLAIYAFIKFILLGWQ